MGISIHEKSESEPLRRSFFAFFVQISNDSDTIQESKKGDACGLLESIRLSSEKF